MKHSKGRKCEQDTRSHPRHGPHLPYYKKKNVILVHKYIITRKKFRTLQNIAEHLRGIARVGAGTAGRY